MTITSDDRRKADYVGQAELSKQGPYFQGHIEDRNGQQLLIKIVEEDWYGKRRLVIVARHGVTPDRARLLRDAAEAPGG